MIITRARSNSRVVFVRFLPIMDFLCFSCVLFMCGFIINEPNSVYATTSTLTMSVAGAISLNIASTSVVGTFAHSDTTTPNINIRTDNGSGYTLGIRASTGGANNNALINTNDNTKTIPSITASGGVSESTYSSDSSYDNTWAYRPSKLNSTVNNNYFPAPSSDSSSIILDQTSVSNPSTDNSYNIAIGVRINNSVHPGSYANTFIITAIANPIPYTITYNKNTSDTVTNMPSNDSNATYSEIVTLSNQIPVRDGYVFKGWCTVQMSDGTACAGTTFNPDGDGTNLNHTIDQTMASASLTIYALWEMAAAPDSCNPNGTTIGTNTGTDILCMQDFASLSSATKTALINSMTVTTQYTLLDKRDNKSYMISKLADGRVWMTQNLGLDLDANTIYTNLDTDLGWDALSNSYQTANWQPLRSTYAATADHTHQWCVGGTWSSQDRSCVLNNTPESYHMDDYYWNQTFTNWVDFSDYYDSCDFSTNTPSCTDPSPLPTYTTITGTPIQQYRFGNYYNWAAAIASNDASIYGVYDNNTSAFINLETNQSICPAGWTLPSANFDGQNTGDYVDLWEIYGYDSSNYAFDDSDEPTIPPIYAIPGGSYNGYLSEIGAQGITWASVAYAYSDTEALNAHFYAGGTGDPAGSMSRGFGAQVRCILRAP